MTEQELLELRNAKWRTNGQPIRTQDDAREYIESVGFCLMYPLRPPVLVPTFIGAWAGSNDNLPTWQHAFADARAKDATEVMVRTLRQKFAFEAPLFGETDFLVSASVFPYFYGLVGDRNPRAPIKTGNRSEYSPLAAHVFQVIQKDGPITKNRMREILGGELSEAAIDRALNELAMKLRITRVDYRAEQGAFWDVLLRWSPDEVREGVTLSIAESLTALVSKYIECVVAAEPTEVEEFFSTFIGRGRVREAINALLAAREFQFVHIGSKTMLQVPPPKPVLVRKMVRPGRPIGRRLRPSAKPAAPAAPAPAKDAPNSPPTETE
ncbi:MAG: crosslink repair DNA glycosylase YcaQ family protein [Acidobacteriota bacterium]|nr:crosslink repair DNA glycosylase YcaQ family protein [Acidobacteriota bacterium]